MFGFLYRLFGKPTGGAVGDAGEVLEQSFADTLVDHVDALENDLADLKKKVEAIRRKVYRDEDKVEDKVPGDGVPAEQSMANFLANLRPGDTVPPEAMR